MKGFRNKKKPTKDVPKENPDKNKEDHKENVPKTKIPAELAAVLSQTTSSKPVTNIPSAPEPMPEPVDPFFEANYEPAPYEIDDIYRPQKHFQNTTRKVSLPPAPTLLPPPQQPIVPILQPKMISPPISNFQDIENRDPACNVCLRNIPAEFDDESFYVLIWEKL